MALANYTDLVSAISSWTHRGDLSSIAPDLIALAELRIYHGSKDPLYPSEPLRIRIMEEQATGNASSGVISVPSGYVETIRLLITVGGKNRELRYQAPQANTAYETETGNASFYTRINEGFKVGPQTAAYTLDYYKRFDALTSGATTNALMTAHPNVYLYGSLLEAFIYTGNVQKADWAHRLYMGSMNGLQSSDRRNAYGIAPAVVAVS